MGMLKWQLRLFLKIELNKRISHITVVLFHHCKYEKILNQLTFHREFVTFVNIGENGIILQTKIFVQNSQK